MNTIKDFDLKGKKVILRVDFNVPIKDGIITDDNRIQESLRTIEYLIDNDAKLIILSHLGKVKTEEDKAVNDMKIVHKHFEYLLGKKVVFSNETRGKDLEDKVASLKEKDVLLLQNTRYEDYPNKLESGCDVELSKYWASLGDIFILDAFGSAHREHASTYGISKYLPHGIGFLIEREMNVLDTIMKEEKNLILGGFKVVDKLPVIENLLSTSKNILIGGAMCATFLKAEGYNVGKTFVDEEQIEYTKELLKSKKITLPIDVVTEDGVKSLKEINDNDTIYDIGPKTVELFKKNIDKKLITVCNGTMGLFEEKKYSNGTRELFEFLSDNKVKTVVCGGDTASAVVKLNKVFYYISTGGGASLEYLSGKKMGALEICRKTKKKIILNNKSYLGYDEIKKYKTKIEKIKTNYEIILFPSVCYLSMFKDSKVNVGSQNFYTDTFGSYTGEITLEALKSININYTLVSHSERKKYYLDSIERIKDKTEKSLDNGFNTILCVGAQTKVLNENKSIKQELDFVLKNVKDVDLLRIAYEPGWAIGTGKSESIDNIVNTIDFIKSYFKNKYDKNIEVYYGGSVNKENIKEIIDICDGVLIGKISSDIESIKEIINIL